MTLPLEGVKVLEVAEQSFVPSGTAVLADWGADVVKVERPEGDPLRAVMASGLIARTGDFDYLVEQMNRNKRGVSIDLRTEAGRAALDRLVAWADVYVTNFLPSACDKLRLRPEDLFAVNPSLVYARGHGQGIRGPDADTGGYDAVSFWSRGGIAHMLTDLGSEDLVRQRPAQGDVTAGMFLAGGIAAALVRRLRTGEGAVVDCSLLGSAVWTLSPDLVAASVLGEEPERIDPLVLPNPLIGTFRTSDDRWIMLTMLDTARFWERMCAVIDRPDLVSKPVEEVTAEAIELRELIRTVFVKRPLSEWESLLDSHGCIFGRVSDPVDVLADGQVQANDYLPRHATHRSARVVSSPIQFDEKPVSIERAAPEMGEHTDEVLRDLGYTDADLVALRDEGAIC